jgi:hypothetical protein
MVWEYVRSLFSRKPDVATYLEQNPFYANGCARHFNESFERGIVKRAVKDAERELMHPVRGGLTDLLDGLFLGRKISAIAWRTYSLAADKDALSKKPEDPRFQKRMEEEIILGLSD